MAKKNPKETSPKVASKASNVLRKPDSTPDDKSAAASAVAQTRPRKRG